MITIVGPILEAAGKGKDNGSQNGSTGQGLLVGRSLVQVHGSTDAPGIQRCTGGRNGRSVVPV